MNDIMLTVTFSNRYEELLDALLQAAASTPESPFSQQQIVIPSAAVRRHLELSLAKRFGICANVDFPYLGAWIWRQIRKIIPLPDDSPYAPETLSWRIGRILDDKVFVLHHARLSAYLEQADPVMRHELSVQLATLIEQTITYRPDWIDAWSANKFVCLPGGTRHTAHDLRWQADLWRRLMHNIGSNRHLPAILEKLEQIDDAAASRLRQSGTVHLFCLPAIAPLHIDILNVLARWMDLRLYVLNPCREYWFDIVDPKRLLYLAAKGQADHHETGNRLLSSWGGQTQAMIDLLFDKTAIHCNELSRFISNAELGTDSLLAQVQDAILELKDLPPQSIPLKKDDRSIEIHCCHSLTRELEVLQDQLLALFAGENPPRPEDVLVVTPDLDKAVPLIDAVFGTAPPARRIPYAITGHGNGRVNPVAEALLDLLSLLSSRFAASAVFELLQRPVVARHAGLDQAKLDALHEWMAVAGIRWGLDASHRGQLGLPETDDHSFADGLDRLLLGYAMPAGYAVPFGGRLGAGNPEGTTAQTLGIFAGLMRALAAARQEMRQPKTPMQWMSWLFETIDAFIAAEGNLIDDLREARSRISELCLNMRQGGGDDPVDHTVLRIALKAAFDDPARGGIPFGMLTFTSMNSLRNLPYRIVCAIGLNDGSFPSVKRPPEFDLIAVSPRRGDRQRRIDERNLFLDLLLAARERLYLSYTGRSVRDNSPMPPSVLLSDLLDTLIPALEASRDEALRHLLIEHPLQPFADAYFRQDGDPRIASSNETLFRAIKEKRERPIKLQAHVTETADDENGDDDVTNQEDVITASRLFFDPPRLSEPGPAWRELSLEQLIRFFRNPSRYLLRERLGISFAEQQEELDDDEPFLPDVSARTALASRLLPLYLAGATESDIFATAAAGLEYPAGDMGRALLQQEMQALRKFAQEIAPTLATPCLPSIEKTLTFDLEGEVWRLNDALADLRPSGLAGYRYARVQAQDYLVAWIRHLFLNACAPDGVTLQSTWHGRDKAFTLPPLDDAKTQLQRLIELYRTGLSHPLRFYPRSAWEFIDSGKDFNTAWKTWRNWKSDFSEERDPFYRQSLRGVEQPLDDEFVACADFVFGRLNALLKGASA